jgi:hypothetical protein
MYGLKNGIVKTGCPTVYDFYTYSLCGEKGPVVALPPMSLLRPLSTALRAVSSSLLLLAMAFMASMLVLYTSIASGRTGVDGEAGTGGGVLLSVRDRAWAFSSGLPKPLVGLLCAEPGPVKEGFRPDENWDDMGLLLGCILSPTV